MKHMIVKIITYDVGYRDDIVPKAVNIAKKVGLKAGNNLPQPHPFFWRLQKIVASC